MKLTTIINRLREPSTFASLAGLFLLLGVSYEEFETYSLALSGLFAFIGIFLKEGNNEEITEEGI